MEEEDKDIFLDEEVAEVADAVADEQDDIPCFFPSSPILNTPSLKLNFNHAGRRKNRLRRSGSGLAPGSSITVPITHNLQSYMVPPMSPNDSILASQQSDFIPPKTPVRSTAHRNLSRPDSESEDDIFATVPCTAVADEAIPSALDALIDGPGYADVSWTSSMATPLTGNVTWSNLNTEERKVLLPSEDCTISVRPRALFSPDANDVGDCHSLNLSSDIENPQALNGENTFKTPKSKQKSNSENSKVCEESPLSTGDVQFSRTIHTEQSSGLFTHAVDQSSINETEAHIVAGNLVFSPEHKFCKLEDQAPVDSPILSGSSKFAGKVIHKTVCGPQGDEDFFNNSQESFNDILPCSQNSSKNSSAAESTPNSEFKRKSPLCGVKIPLAPSATDSCNVESFLQDISVTTLEKVCQVQEQNAALSHTLETAEKQQETKRKRLFFSNNIEQSPGAPPVKKQLLGPVLPLPPLQEKDNIEVNHGESCIPDDSFMEHMAAMSTTIFSDNLEPLSRVQSIKTSFSHKKKFCYSVDQDQDFNTVKPAVSSEPQVLMNEILKSVIALESSPITNSQRKCLKSNGDLVVFSQLQEDETDVNHMEKVSKTNNHHPGHRTQNLPQILKENENDLPNNENIVAQPTVLPSEGFQTARGESIKFSQEALQRGLKLLKDVLEATGDTEQNLTVSSSSNTALSEISETNLKSSEVPVFSDVQMVQEEEEEVKQLLQLVNDGEDFHPWHEIEQSDYNPSNEELKSKNSYKFEEKQEIGKEKSCSEVFVDSKFDCTKKPEKRIEQNCDRLSRASGKTILNATESLDKSKQIFHEQESILNENKIHPEIQDSRKHKNGQAKLNEVNDSHQMDNGPGCGSTSASVGGINISQKALSIINSLFEEIPPTMACNTTRMGYPLSPKKDDFAGFSTASGKTVVVSEQAIMKVNKLFDDILTDTDVNRDKLSCAVHPIKTEVLPQNEGQDSMKSTTLTSSHKSENVPKNASSEFYNQTHDLKTETNSSSKNSLLMSDCEAMAAFSTASGKSVSVSKEALNKVAKLFEDIPSEPICDSEAEASSPLLGKLQKRHKSGIVSDSLKQMVQPSFLSPLVTSDSKRNTVSSTSSNKMEKVSQKASRKGDVDFSTLSCNIPADSDSGMQMVGFSTASGRSVKVSEESLKKVKGLFDDLSSETDLKPADRFKVPKCRDEVCKNQTEELLQSGRLAGGFSTASGRAVHVSEQALKKAKNLFDSCEVSDSPFDFERSSSTLFGREGRENLVKSGDNSMPMVGFSTASGRNVSISKEALSKAQKLFDNLSSESVDGQEENIQSEGCNQTQLPGIVADEDSGISLSHEISFNNMPQNRVRRNPSQGSLPKKSIASCSDNKEKHRKNFSQNLDDHHNQKISLNKEVKSSTAAFMADEEFFNEAELLNAASNVLSSRNYPKELSENVQYLSKNLKGETNSSSKHSLLMSDCEAMAAFSTASGKSVSVSKEALNKVAKLFEDIPSEPICDSEVEASSPLLGKLQKRHKSGIVSDSLKQMVQPSFLSPLVTSDSKRNTVSSTSSNKMEKVSQKASRKGDVDFSTQSCNIPADSDSGMQMVGFSTASGRSVKVSEESLKKVKGLFDDLSSETDLKPADRFKVPKCRDEVCKNQTEELLQSGRLAGGFSTASGRAVHVSEQALKKAKNLFDSCEVSDSPFDFERSSSTLFGREGRENLAKSGDNSMPMVGFSTASGRNVSISKEALSKAQKLFDNLSSESVDGQEENIQSEEVCKNQTKELLQSGRLAGGFSTASGRAVHVSEQALKKVKNLFDSCEVSDSPFDFERRSSTLCGREGRENLAKSGDNSLPMVGFSTASGQNVSISKEALSKAQKLFDNLSSESIDGQEENIQSEGCNQIHLPGIVADEDSGISFSHEISSNNMPQNRVRRNPSQGSLPKKSMAYCSDNKENQRRNFQGHEDNQIQKTSLTQEISASTAALMADDEFFNEAELLNAASNVLNTISTSPSMITDRVSCLEPVISSTLEGNSKVTEPTSPILVRSDSMGSRRRTRKGRLSLSSVVNISRSLSPILGPTPAASSQVSKQTSDSQRLSSISTNMEPPLQSNFAPALEKAETFKDPVRSCNISSSLKSVPKAAPSRKLFPNDSNLSPLKLETEQNLKGRGSVKHVESQDNIESLKKGECAASSSTNLTFIGSKSKESLHCKTSYQSPLKTGLRKRNNGTQLSTFRTPYKIGSEDHPKRCPSSPAQNPPEAKRRKSSSNLYASHILIPSSNYNELDARYLRPEVAEMRRRSADEQKRLVENNIDEKGDLLQPCCGSWLAKRISGVEKRVKLSEMSEIEQPQNYAIEELLSMGLKTSTCSVHSSNSMKFRFSAWDHYSADVCKENVAGLPVGDGARLVLDLQGSAGVEEFERAFLASPGVDPSLVPSGWVQNHYRWLVWKLASTEKMFPHNFGGRCLTPHILMLQLKYRYDREIDRCERPAIRRILEQDDSPAKRMVLCVAGIKNLKDSDQGLNVELELTDGWYSITASIDQEMQRRVSKGVIAVGTKLIMHSAELLNCSEGCSPLQARPDCRLKLVSNSTRRARWYAKLGFQPNPGPLKIPITSIISSGGTISCLVAYVARVYPLVYMEKNGEKTVVRSQRAEAKEEVKSEKKRQKLAEVIYSQVQNEIQKEQSKQKHSSLKKFSLKQLSALTSGEELAEVLENSSDPLSVQNMLTEEQKNLIAEYQRCKKDEISRDLEARVRMKLSENPDNDRQISPLLKIRLYDDNKKSSAILSIWRPSEDMTSMFKEGHKVTVFGAVSNGLRCGEVQLSANRSTRYLLDSNAKINSDLLRHVSPLSSLKCRGALPRFGEIDIVGVVVRVSPAPQTSENMSRFQTVYLSDSEQNIVGVSFREGIKEFGVEDLIAPSSILAASNLQWRAGSVVKTIPCVYASELSFFTTSPRQSYLQSALQDLRQSLPMDLKTFCKACEAKLDNLLSPNSASAQTPAPPPATVTTSTEPPLSMLRSSSSNQSTLIVKAQRKLSMDQQLCSPSSSNSLSPAVEKRISKLESYGTPPPLSPMACPLPRSTRKDFKAPRRTDSPLVGKNR